MFKKIVKDIAIVAESTNVHKSHPLHAKIIKEENLKKHHSLNSK